MLASLFLTGCTPLQGHFQAMEEPAYHGTMSRVLVVSFNEDLASHLGHDFSNRMLNRITHLLAQNGVAVEVAHQNKNNLDPMAPVKAAAARFHPQQLLYVAVTRVFSNNNLSPASFNSLPQFSSEVSIDFGFSIIDMQTGKTVWRGDLQFSTVPTPGDVADQLVKQLEAERLL